MGQIQIDPEIEKRPVLAPREDYGKDGDATLENVGTRSAPWDNSLQVLHVEVVVRDKQLGIVRVFKDFDLRQGSQVPRILRQLGIPNDQQKAGFDPEELNGKKVIADIGVRSYTKDGEEVTVNTVKNLHGLR